MIGELGKDMFGRPSSREQAETTERMQMTYVLIVKDLLNDQLGVEDLGKPIRYALGMVTSMSHRETE